MKEVIHEKRQLRIDIARAYNKKTAFGDPLILKLLHRYNEISEWIERTVECDECEGHGYVDHNCDCSLCDEREDECKNCFGEGRVEKS